MLLTPWRIRKRQRTLGSFLTYTGGKTILEEFLGNSFAVTFTDLPGVLWGREHSRWRSSSFGNVNRLGVQWNRIQSHRYWKSLPPEEMSKVILQSIDWVKE